MVADATDRAPCFPAVTARVITREDGRHALTESVIIIDPSEVREGKAPGSSAATRVLAVFIEANELRALRAPSGRRGYPHARRAVPRVRGLRAGHRCRPC